MSKSFHLVSRKGEQRDANSHENLKDKKEMKSFREEVAVSYGDRWDDVQFSSEEQKDESNFQKTSRYEGTEDVGWTKSYIHSTETLRHSTAMQN